MKLAKLIALALGLTFTAGEARTLAEGGELGNAFVPFASKLGDFSLEYSKKWNCNDLSYTTSFSAPESSPAAGSFLSVGTSRGEGPGSLAELREQLEKKHPGVRWGQEKFSGILGLAGERSGIRMLYLLRAPGDLISIRFRASGGERADQIIRHMLESFRAD
jgi:hypothetical protein